MALTTSPTDYANLCTGRIAAAITTTTSTGVTVTADTFKTPAGTGSSTWPTGPQVWKISRKTRTNTEVEFVGVETASQSGTTVTTGTINRYLPANGSSLTSQGSGLSFPAGSVVELVWHAFSAEKVPYKDVANSFTADQTFTGAVIVNSTTKTLQPPQMTTTQRDAVASPRGIIENTTTGAMNQYIGGAWSTFATGSVVAASNTVAGKLDVATAAEIAAATALDATSGVSNALVVANTSVNAASANWVSGGIPALNTAKLVDGSLGGTGVASPVLGALLIGGGAGLAMTPIGPGSAFQVPSSNGTTLSMTAVPTYSLPVFQSAVTSATLTNPTSATAYATHTYTIPANTLVSGVWYEFEITVRATHNAAGTFVLGVGLGAAYDTYITSESSSATCSYTAKGMIMGTTTAGAAAAVRISIAGTTSPMDGADEGYISVAKATNGTLAITFFANFGTSDGGNVTTAVMSVIKKVSTTAFTAA